ncbi:glycosyltransferase family 29 protein [Campylobacter sp. MG1]|uniref:glycosyltransferase family 29 protein n=1 Tax=Campylobacter sp. MG1 TaxID=2976332 RepID=UPI00226D39AF|nr:glycosyltransferase family 29 protein [Campylobacter sp. MG1]
MSVSIIVPCYNVEKYLDRSINSLIKQTLEDIEIICINDGSTDNTYEKLLSFKNISDKIYVYNKTNGGYGSTVNLGITKATKDYIAIFEPDDEVGDDYYELLYLEASVEEKDVVMYGTYIERHEGFKDQVIYRFENVGVNDEDFIFQDKQIARFLSLGNVGITFGIYSKKLITENNITLNTKAKSYEDVEFMYDIYQCAKNIGILPSGSYYYYRDIPTQSVGINGKFERIIIIVKSIYKKLQYKDKYKENILGYLLTHLIVNYNRSNNTQIKYKIEKLIIFIINNNDKITISKSIFQQLKNKLLIDNSNILKFKIIEDKINIDNNIRNFININNSTSLSIYLSKLNFLLNLINEENFQQNSNLLINTFISALNNLNTEKQVKDFLKIICKNTNIKNLINYHPNIRNIILFNMRKYNIINNLHFYLKNKYFYNSDYYLGLENFKELNEIPHYYHMFNVINSIKINNIEFEQFIRNKTIAIVGNSPTIMNENKGNEIDNHDIVVRFNNYPVDYSLQRHTGSKTDIWAISPALESIFYKENTNNIKYIFIPLTHTTTITKLNLITNLNDSGLKIVRYSAQKYLNIFNMQIMSLGLIMILFFLERKNQISKINLYGFSLEEQEQGIKHYFKGDISSGKILKFHKWKKEWKIFNSIKKQIKEKNA